MSYIEVPIKAPQGGTGTTTYAVGDVLYASATDALSKRAISTSLGAPLSTDGTSPIYRNPQKYVYLVDDFVGVEVTQALGWRGATANSGSISYNGSGSIFSSTSARVGTVAFSTSSNTAGRCNYATYVNGANSSGAYTLGGGAITITWDVMLTALSDANTTYQFWCGLGTGSDYSEPTSGCYFSYIHSDNSGQWVGKTANASSRTPVNSSIAVAANTWYRLRVDINAGATSVEFFVNDVSIGSTSNDITSNTLGAFVETVKTGGAVGSAIIQTHIDMFTFYKELTTQR